ncbi:MAG: hypothetical protein IKM39_03305, partial [Clostridia bacterium]|nr:hypothetical protein [Clostridia bacterium]
MNYQSCFEKLTGAVGGDLNNAILSLLPSGCTHEISPLGNLTVTFKGDSDAVLLLDAHKDTIHFVVTSITPDGFIKVAPCGGIDSRVIVGSEVTV